MTIDDVRVDLARLRRSPKAPPSWPALQLVRGDRQPLVSVYDPMARHERRLTAIRRVAIWVWATAVVFRTVTEGVPFKPDLLLIYISTGLAAASIGRRNVWFVIRDLLPFLVVPLAYGVDRGLRDFVGLPTMWTFPVDADRWMFFGVIPTLWLQEHIKMAQPPLWEVIIDTVYMSYFIVPYVLAAALWLRSRDECKAFGRRFAAISLSGYAIYLVLPAAPPWAAARCTEAEISSGPANPECMLRNPAEAADGGLLGALHSAQPGANDFVERISWRGWSTLHLDAARSLVDLGQSNTNMVAAIPSLHAAITAMVAAFLWHLVSRKWRPVLAAYVVTMCFALVYSAEHYVIDLVLGFALAAAVMMVVGRIEARRAAKATEPAVPDSR